MNYKTTVFAPHDRMNYGDFLFAIMLDFALKRKDQTADSLEKHSIIAADFSTIGAYKTGSYKTLMKDVNQKKINSIIIGGGQSLSANWVTIYSYINPLIYFLTFKLRLHKLKIYHKFIIKFLGGKSDFPYNINKRDYNNKSLKIIYNSVGSGGITKNAASRLNEADYVAVRDLKSFQHISSVVKNVKIIPDSAIILSDVFSVKKNKLIDKDYIFFQSSLYKYGNDLSIILYQLNEILAKTQLSIVLCPIGTAPGHNDDVLLKKIKSKIKNDRLILREKPTIEEIVNLIAQSKCYVGTSLHGIITAMSYNVPYIGLNKKQIKLVSYNETWAVDDLKEIQSTDNFCYKTLEILQKNTHNEISNKIKSETEIQKQKYYNAFDEIFEIIKLNLNK